MSGLNPDGLGVSRRFTALETDSLLGDWDHLVETSESLNDVLANDVSAGDVVQLTNGTHTVTKSGLSALEIVADNVTLRGMGRGVSIIKLEDNASTDAASIDDEAVLAIGTDGGASPTGVTVRDLTIDGNKPNQTTASNELVHGIQPHDADDWTIENVEVRNCTNGGIHNKFDDTGSGAVVDGCYVHDCERDLIFLSTDDLHISNTLVENSPLQDGFELAGANQTVTNCISRNIAQQCFEIYRGENVTVSNCIAIYGPNGTVAGYNFNGTSGDNTTNSTFRDCLYVGSNDSANADKPFNGGSASEVGDGCSYEGCTSYQAGQQLSLNGVVEYSDITLIGSAGRAASVDSSGVSIRELTILNAGGRGLRIDADDTTVNGAKILDSSDNGILVNANNNVRLHDVQVRDSGSFRGINILSCDGVILRGVTMSGHSREVDITNCDNVTVDGFECTGGSNDGIRLNENDGAAHQQFELNGLHIEGRDAAVAINVGTGAITDVSISNTVLDANTSDYDVSAGTRVFRNGTEFKSSAPTAADYDSQHIGKKILDQSASPSDVYYVDGAGSLDGPV